MSDFDPFGSGDPVEDEETPPEPVEPGPQEPLTLEQRLNLAYSLLTPEQKIRYDEATTQIMDTPVMQAFASNEAAHEEKVSTFREQFLKEQKKKQAK